MSTLATLTVKVIGDVQDFESKMKSAESTTKTVMGGMKKAGLGLTAGVTVPIAGMGLGAIMAASDLEESMNKVNVVFGESSGLVTDFSSEATNALGITSAQALEAAGTYGNLFTSMGIGQQASAEMSTELLTLAADLASFNNIDPTVALEKLRSGLVGETMPLRSLGVNLNAAMIEAKAFEMGLVEMTEAGMEEATEANYNLQKATEAYQESLEENGPLADETTAAQIKLWKAQEKYDQVLAGTAKPLSAAAKAQASYQLIMEQTTNAQGDFGRTSDGLANSMRIAKAQIGELAAQLGTYLLPYVQEAVLWVRDLFEKFLALNPETQKLIMIILGVLAALGPILLILPMIVSGFAAIGTIIGAIIPIIGGLIAFITGPLFLVLAAVVAIVALVYLAWKNNWGGIQEKTKVVVEWIRVNVAKFLKLLQKWWDEHGESVMTIVRVLWEFIQKVVKTGIEIVQKIIDFVLKVISKVWNEHGNEIMAFVKSTWETIKRLIRLALDFIGAIVDAFAALLTGDWEKFWDKIKEAASIAWEFIKTVWANAQKGIQLAFKIWKTVLVTVWIAFTTWFKNKVNEIWNNVKTAFETGKANAISAIQGMISGIKAKFNINWDILGRKIIDGIRRGITNGVEAIKDAAKRAARAALDAAKDFLGIKSPSVEFMKIGNNAVAGFIEPFLKADMTKVMGNFTAQALKPVNLAIATQGSGGSNTYNYNLTANTKYESEQSATEKLRLMTLMRG